MSTEQTPVDSLPPVLVPGTYDTLPCGVRVEGYSDRIRTFELHEHTAEDVSVIGDRKVIRRSATEYLMRVVAVGVQSIGDIPVYEPFAASKFTVVPDVVKDLVVGDAEFLVLCAQMYSYGDESTISVKCPECETTIERPFKISNVQPYSFPEGNYDPIVHVTFDRSFRLPIPQFPKYHEEQWNSYSIRAPQLRDLKAVERRGDEGVAYSYRVLARCVIGATSEAGMVLPEEVLSGVRESLITKMPARNALKISREMVKVFPHVDREIVIPCSVCDYEIREGLDPTTLSPGG